MNIERMMTNKTAAWIANATKGNPAVLLESGNVRMPPCRLSYANVVKPGKDSVDKVTGAIIKGRYGASLLFAEGADLTAARAGRMAMMKTAFPKNPDGLGFEDPIKDQGDHVAPSEGGTNKMGKTTGGYVPGSFYISANANLEYPPTLTVLEGGKPDYARGSQEELLAKFYSGAWVIPTLTIFHGRNPTNPNIFFGLSSVLWIADDQKFGGGGGDGPDAYAGISIDQSVDVASLM